MKLQVTQENLHKSLSVVSRVADARGSLPILSHVLIKTDRNRITLAATNLEIAITQTIGGKVINPGSLTVPAKLMNDFIASLPSGTINLETDGHKLHIKSGSHTSTINGMLAEEFPEIPTVEQDSAIVLTNTQLKQALSQTVFAASNDEARPVLTGLLFDTNETGLVIVSTDSYRLAEKTIPGLETQQPTLIPASAAQDVLRILSDNEEEVELYLEEAQAQFRIGETELVTRLIDGTFPEYKRLLPTETETTVVVDRAELIGITKTASLFARESAGSITLQVSAADQTIGIHSVASQVGENSATIQAEASGDGTITLNSRFLLEGLNAFTSKTITLSFTGKVKPFLLTSPEENPDYLHVVMPLKT